MRTVLTTAIVLIASFTLLPAEIPAQLMRGLSGLTEPANIHAQPDYGMLAEKIESVSGKQPTIGLLSPVTQIVGSDSLENAFFGIDVAIEGNTAVVGAYNELVPPYRTGAVYVFNWNGSNWSQQQKLTRPPNSSGGDFGRSVDISGDTIIIGDPDHSCGPAAVDCGEIFFFQRTGSTWSQAQRVRASDWEDTHQFGWDVAISGDWAVVGENAHPINISSPGSAYFFQRVGGVWTEVQKVNHGGNTNDLFGYSVAIEGDRAIIGFPRYANYVGGACVYNRAGSTWALGQCLAQNDPGDNCLGESLSISGDTILAGAPCNNGGAGYVFVTEDAGITWQQEAKLNVTDGGPGDGLGVGAGIDGDRAVLGAWVHNGSRGAGYSFVRCLNDWALEEKFVAAGGAPGDNFGRSAAVFSNRAIFGAPFMDVGGIDDRGAAYTTVIGSSMPLGAQCDLSIEVNRTTDEADDDINDDVCDIDENTLEHECTLRAAIETANARTGRDIISFDIPGGGIKTIAPGSNLPYLDESASIDATTQPGYSGQPLIQLAGGAMGVNPGLGMITGSDNSRVRGMAIYGFETNIVIQSSSSSVESCYVGIKADGSAPTSGAQSFGVVLVNGAANVYVGGTDASDGNVIGNLTVGVGIYGGSNNNRVLNNKIGTNPAGTATMPNEVGVVVNGSNGNRIGQAGDGNLISGNTFAGVLVVSASSTLIRGNRIGTDATGTSALANLHGVAMNGGTNNKVGDIAIEDGNLISGNDGFGVVAYNSAANNRIIHNSIGTTLNGTSTLANEFAGVFIEGGATNNTVEKNVVGGHDTSQDAVGIGISASAGTANVVKGNFVGIGRNGAALLPNSYGIASLADGQIIGAPDEGNIVGFNDKAGIYIGPDATGGNPSLSGNTVHYNFVGTNGTADRGNTEFGILIEGDASGNNVLRNIVSGNDGFGIGLTDLSHDNLVKENFVGTNAAGNAAVPNGGGIWLRQSSNNTIESNLVSGNVLGILVGTGIGFEDDRPSRSRPPAKNIVGGEYTTGNQIFGNTVGLNAARTAAISGSSMGIAVGENARGNVIGSASGAYNLVSGNTRTVGYGIFVGTLVQNPGEGALPRQNRFEGNVVGLAGDLATTVPNKVGFVLINAVDNTVGGNTRALGNTIVGSTEDGVQITDGTRNNTISNNYIGVLPAPQNRSEARKRPDGSPETGNLFSGVKIALSAIANKIQDNVIGYNRRHGIEIEGLGTPGETDAPTLITGNYIGVILNGAGSDLVDIGNTLSGISINGATNIQIGDAGEQNANVIGKNLLHGVSITNNSTLVTTKRISAVNNYLGMIKNAVSSPLPAGNGSNALFAQSIAGLDIGGDTSDLVNRLMASGGKGMVLKLIHPTTSHPFPVKIKNALIGAILDSSGNVSPNLGNAQGGLEVEDSSAIEIGSTDEKVSPTVVASNGAFGFKAIRASLLKVTRSTFIKNLGPALHFLQSTNSSVTGNGIGVALGAQVANSGNDAQGVLVEESPGLTIGGSKAEDYNKIGFHALAGAIHILNTHPASGSSLQTLVKGNLMGGRSGTVGGIVNRAANKVGLFIENSSYVTVGGTSDAEGNSIVASTTSAIRVKGALSRAVTAINNFMGKVAQHHGTEGEPMGNGEDGTVIEDGANNNSIGGEGVTPLGENDGSTSLGNTIAGNGRNGILLAPSAGNNNRLGGNNIFGNVRFGIDLGNDGTSANDPLDADVGANNLQNYPDILSRQVINNELIVDFRLDSDPANSAYGTNGIAIEFFKASPSGEGERFLGSRFYTLADYNSLVPGTKTVNLGNLTALGINADDQITATATDANGNTSEFAPQFGPTAASVVVSGRVTLTDSSGLRNAIVTITDMSGNSRSNRTGAFGYYRFEDVQAGSTYVITVTSKRFSFAPRVITVTETIMDLDFVATE
jgi:parallel beta-helix repeat protein